MYNTLKNIHNITKNKELKHFVLKECEKFDSTFFNVSNRGLKTETARKTYHYSG